MAHSAPFPLVQPSHPSSLLRAALSEDTLTVPFFNHHRPIQQVLARLLIMESSARRSRTTLGCRERTHSHSCKMTECQISHRRSSASLLLRPLPIAQQQPTITIQPFQSRLYPPPRRFSSPRASMRLTGVQHYQFYLHCNLDCVPSTLYCHQDDPSHIDEHDKFLLFKLERIIISTLFYSHRPANIQGRILWRF